jgi:branched-chain amino acid transport system permease protein
MNQFTKVTNTLARPYLKWPIISAIFILMPWLILAIPIFQANNFTYSQLCFWLALAVAALGLNILTGLTGMISVGHSAVYAIGAFTAGYFTSKAGLPFPVAVVMGAIGGGIVAFILGLPALKLSGPYLAIATFAFAIAVPQLLASSKEVGALFADPNDPTTKIGVFKIPKQTFPGFDLRDDLGRYYLFLAIGVVMFLIAMAIWNSRTGRAFRAIRDSETAALAMGISIGRFKLLAFVISGVYAGVAGSMYTAYVGQIEATDIQFSAIESVIFLAAILLGGLGSIWGAIVGAGFLVLVPQIATSIRRFFSDNFQFTIDNLESIFYGLILILVIFFMPNGITGAISKLYNRLREGKPESIEEEAKKFEETSVFSPIIPAADAGQDVVATGDKVVSTKTPSTSEGA